VRLITWGDAVLAETAVPASVPPSLILRNLQVFDLISKLPVSPDDVKSAAITIERRWSVPELEGWEILGALAHVYGMLSDLVLDGHVVLGKTDCVVGGLEHADFRSIHHPSGTLSCMVVGSERRVQSFSLDTGQRLEFVEGTVNKVDRSAVEKRYQLDQIEIMPHWQTDDPVLVAERIQFLAKRALRRDKQLVRVVFVRDGEGVWHQMAIVASNQTEKYLLMRMVARFIESVGGNAIIDVGEIWTLPSDNPTAIKAHYNGARNVPGRGEAISVLLATREGLVRAYVTPFTRGPFKGIKLSDTEQLDKERPYYLKPIFDVWRIQGITYSKDGKPIRRQWEPDPLDMCFCGSQKRFAQCCKPLIDPPNHREDITEQIHEARAAEDYGRLEALVRAQLAQYVVWVKQHTSPTRHVAPDVHRMWVEIDLPALAAIADQLGAALAANGHEDLFVPQLRRISGRIGVPELSIRLTAIAARWLFAAGEYSNARKEIEALGDLEHVNDPLALILAVQLFDLSGVKQIQLLTRAVAGALWEYERWLAELELARHLSRLGRKDEALQRVDSVIDQLAGKKGNSDVRADALSLRWSITNEDQDFRAARSEIETLKDRRGPQHLAALLIDHGDYGKAEDILADLLRAGDPESQILIVDARTRTNQIDSARELLQQIVPETVTPSLQAAYAVAYALVALACKDDEVKGIAITKLQNLPPIGDLVSEYRKQLLKALEGQGTTRRQSPLSRFGDLLLHRK
jgi:uncharacterized protein YchJ